MVTIENEMLCVSIVEKGAELNSIYHKPNQLEYLWSGDPLFWAKKSPVLFPIVGALKDNTYLFNGHAYELARHGFGRDSLFMVRDQSESSVCFLLQSNLQTLLHFPFDFQFSVKYALHQSTLSVTYEVKNSGKDSMYFSVGGHPAFKVPLEPSARYEDYYLEFDTIENAGRWGISAEGLIELTETPLLLNTNTLPLTKALFLQDALVFKQLSSSKVSLKSHATTHGLHFDFTGFPYLGIWAAKNADFVCIEPWCGIADSVNTNQQLTGKEGINHLEAGEVFLKTWVVEFF